MKSYFTGRAVAVYLALCLLTGVCAGFKACTPSDKKEAITWSKDIRGSLISARPLIIKLKPELAGPLDKIINTSGELITAIEASNNVEALRLIAELTPIFESIAAEFTNDVKILTILAIVDIGLHFLVNHLPDATIANAPPGSAPVKTVLEFRDKQVWGCAYRPDKCKGNIKKAV